MKKLHRMVLRMLPGPFVGALGTLMFLLLMQFLMKYLPELVGKDLPMGVVLELIVNNLAYMLVLAVPMAVLLAVVAAFARISETGAYVVIRSAGVSLPQLMWPAAAVGALVMGGMLYFNNYTLPDANYRAKGLWSDINKKKPAFGLDDGVFFEGLKGYAIRAMHVSQATGELEDITIFDYSDGSRIRTSINASRGNLKTSNDGRILELTLYDGEMHKLRVASRNSESGERYERIRFTRHFLPLDLSDLSFERSDPESVSQTERTMRTGAMLAMVDTLGVRVERSLAEFRSLMDPFSSREPIDNPADMSDMAEGALLKSRVASYEIPDTLAPNWAIPLAALDTLVQNAIFERAMNDARTRQADFENMAASLNWTIRKADSYMVEVHKKFSIAVACLVFILIGAPLVLLFKRGSLGFITALSGGIFAFYWVTLVLGEKVSDKGFLEPWIGMWAANIVIAICALLLLLSGYRGRFGLPNRLHAAFISTDNPQSS